MTLILNEAWSAANDPDSIPPLPSSVPRPAWWNPPAPISTGDFSILDAALGTATESGVHHRRVPSAGGLYPVDVADIDGMSATLALLWWRTVAKYGHRGWISSLLDAGHAIASVEIMAARAGYPVRSISITDSAPQRHPRREKHDAQRAPVPYIRIEFVRPVSDELSTWSGPVMADSSDETIPPAAGTEPAEVLRLALKLGQGGVSLDPLGDNAPLWREMEAVTVSDIVRRRSGVWDASDPVPTWLLEQLAVVLPTGAVMQQIEPDGLWRVSDQGPRAIAAGDARPTLSHWCGGQDIVSAAGAVVATTAPPAWEDAATAGRTVIDAGRRIHCAHLLCTHHGFDSRPIAGWAGADIGTAVKSSPALIAHALAIGPRVTHEPPPKTIREDTDRD